MKVIKVSMKLIALCLDFMRSYNFNNNNNNNNEVYLKIRPINSSRRVQCKKIWYNDSKKVIRQH